MKKQLGFAIAALALAIASPPQFALAQNGQLVAGRDATGATRNLKTDSSGNLYIIGSGSGGIVWGPTNPGVAPAQNPILGAGVDGGGLTRSILTDTSGRQIVIGPETTGSAVVAGGLRTMGSDGVNARDFLTDASGRTVVIGSVTTAADALAAPTTAVAGANLAFGYNGTTFDRLRTLPALSTAGLGLQAVGLAGVYNSTLPTLTNGQYGAYQASAQGGLLSAVSNGTLAETVRSANAGAGTTGAGVLGSGNLVYDGTNWQKSASDTLGQEYVRTDSKQNTYFFTDAFANSGNILFQLQGSGTKTIHVKRIKFAVQNSVAGTTGMYVERRSTASTGGTVSSSTIAKAANANPSATAVANSYTTSPSGGTVVANIDAIILAKTTTSSGTFYEFKSVDGSQDIILSGTSDFLTIRDSAATTDATSIQIEWTEE
jgi:hypothetical protein